MESVEFTLATAEGSKFQSATKSSSDSEILRRRAQLLARPLVVEDASNALVRVLEFTLGKEHYAFEVPFVREVFPLTEITWLPGVPDYVMGVINVRGRVLSVMDIRRLFDFGSVGLTNLNKTIILRDDKMEVAILADEVIGVREVDLESGQTSHTTFHGRHEEYVKRVTSDQLIVLDAKKLLNSREILVGWEESE